METGLTINNLKKISFGDRITVRGKVASGAKRFAVNLGQDASNYLIHFNPRFDQNNGVIVCNYKIAENWGPEVQISEFPFRQNEEAEISFLFEGKQVRVYCPGEIIFISKLDLDKIDFVAVWGDFKVHSISME